MYADEGFTSHLLTSFMQNTENREKALIYALLMSNEEVSGKGFSLEAIDAAMSCRGIVLSQKALDEACDVLSLAGVIHRKGREFYFTSPVFTKVIQQAYDLNYLFRKVKEEGYDRSG